jgi:DNA-binding CsgD family transcriptional regulator
MALETLQFRNPISNSTFPSRLSVATEKLSHLQAELISEALSRSVDDASAAMAHQLSEPLTALLYHLHDLKRRGDTGEGIEAVPASVRGIFDVALREIERVCDIVERMDRTIEPSVGVETAITRGYQAIDSWSRNRRAISNGGGSPPAVASLGSAPVLTPREREVLALIVGGASNKEGGYRLGISTRTFEAHRAHLMGKLRAKNAAHLVSMALCEGL